MCDNSNEYARDIYYFNSNSFVFPSILVSVYYLTWCSHGCALINRLNNEFVFNITGSILEYYESCRILKNANACPCISYDRCRLDNVSANMYTAVAGMGCKAIWRFTATVWGKFTLIGCFVPLFLQKKNKTKIPKRKIKDPIWCCVKWKYIQQQQ